LGVYIRLAVGGTNGRARGKLVLWESVEIPEGVAKLVPLHARLASMCGSVVHHVKGLSCLLRMAECCSP